MTALADLLGDGQAAKLTALAAELAEQPPEPRPVPPALFQAAPEQP